MKNNKYNLIPHEVIEKAITGDTAALLAVQERYKACIGRLCIGNADLKERLNRKLLMAVLWVATTAAMLLLPWGVDLIIL